MQKNAAIAVILLVCFIVWLVAIIIGMKMVNNWVRKIPRPLLFPKIDANSSSLSGTKDV
jgi:hypothetical protein